MSSVIPVLYNDEEFALCKYSIGLTFQMYKSMYHCGFPRLNISVLYKDDSSFNNMWFELKLTENFVLRCPTVVCRQKFIFTRNTENNTVDLVLEMYDRIEHNVRKVVYFNCLYFGIGNYRESTNNRESSTFIASNATQDKIIYSFVDVSFYPLNDFHYVVQKINNFIQKTLIVTDCSALPLLEITNGNEQKHTLNNDDAICSYFVETQNVNENVSFSSYVEANNIR